MPRMPRRTTMTRGIPPTTSSHPTAAMRTNYNINSVVVDTNDAAHTAVSSIETNDRRINLKSSATTRSKEKRLEEKQYNTDTSCVYCGESSGRSNPPPLMSTAAMNGNNNYHSNHNNHSSVRSNGGTIKQPRNDDNDQYNCNYIDYFTNNLNYNEDRVYGGSYDDNIHGYNNGHTKNNNNHAAIVLSSSSWPGMNRAVDIDIDEDDDDDDDEVVDELSDLIGISLNGYGGSNNSNNGGRGDDDDDDVNEERNLSPTPLMSFDYNGYEPPTPVRNNNDNIGGGGGSGGNIFFPQQQQQDEDLLVPPPNLYNEDDDDDDDDSHDMKDYTTIIQQTTKDYASSAKLDNDILAYLPGSGGRARYCCSIPTYLHQLSQIVITKISAHPQGHHVLLISAEGLLFSYGSNRYGQLGIGNQSINQTHQQQQIQTTNDRNINANDNDKTTKAITDTNQRQRKSATTTMMMPQQQQQSSNTDYSYYQHSIPTIVTPLLENGGKTINCAAGIDYSLVVVKTECIRIKYQSPQRLQHQHHNRIQTSHHHHHGTVATTSAQQEKQHEYHHQMYGFGNNHDRKLGLLDPDRAGSSSSSSSSSQHHRSTTTASNRISVLLPGSPNSIGSLGDVSCNTEDTAGSSSGNCYNSNNNNNATTTTDTTFDEFANCVYLPRRVALHCRVRHEKQSQSHTSSVSSPSLTEVEAVETESSSSSKFPPPYGIFSIAASVEHSSALVKRPSGDIEVYTWGGGGIINMSLLPTTTTTTTTKK
jgi:hypothetical protein